MASNRKDLTTDKWLKLLTPEWQKVEDLMPEVMGTVPSGFALRNYEARALMPSRKQREVTKPREVSEDAKITSGKRAIANDRKITLFNSGRAEQFVDESNVRWIRLTAAEAQRQADEYAASQVCQACQRPFTQATESLDPTPSRTTTGQTVLYPVFPQWVEQERVGAT